VEIADGFDERGLRVRCRIIGEGPLEPELRRRIARRKLEGVVELTGAAPQADVRAALYRAAIFVLPSVVTPSGDRDGIPVSLMEAMAAGTPVVSTRVSGIPELVEHGREGLLVPEHSPAALADALARLLQEPALGHDFARAAREKVEREFDASREARKLLALFADGRG
jgi:colanic acid/amylovoran biosynthesis glycosyltransferase